MKRLLVLLSLCTCLQLSAQVNDTITELFHNSYRVYQLQRTSDGMYRDSKLFDGLDFHPVSIANTGIGLVSLCIADSMGWEFDARAEVLITLKTLTGHNPSYIPDRSSDGYFRHFLEIDSGANAWNSEYSTIDTDILVCGALFCKNYFLDDSVSKYVDELWESIEFQEAIADPVLGRIYREMDSLGGGKPNTYTLPYNEYMIVAWLAKNESSDPNSPGNQLWNNFYATSANFPKPEYAGFEIPSDDTARFLSSFTHQFNYYLVYPFALDSMDNTYRELYKNAYKGDSAWWQNIPGIHSYEWGLGAGSAISGFGYHADKINDNPDTIVSPHIIAGYLPVNPAGKDHLLAMYRSGKGLFQLPLGAFRQILWRYSVTTPSWVANEVQGIDYSSMLFGLASLPEYLGPHFFSRNNNFFDPRTSVEPPWAAELKVYPNPAKASVSVELQGVHEFQFRVLDVKGRAVKVPIEIRSNKLILDVSSLNTGFYFVRLEKDQEMISRKILIEE